MSISTEQRWSRSRPCVICGGSDQDHRGAAKRCFGFLSDDGQWAHCTREDRAGPIPLKDASLTYAHKLTGRCLCGEHHGGPGDVVDIGTSKRAAIVGVYDYVDEHGELRYQVVRKEPKTFLQRRPDPAGGWIWKLDGVSPLLYRLPDVIAAREAGDDVWIVEGERDVHTLERHGMVATCNSGGASKFPAEQARHLAGANVVIVRDQDDPGRDHAKDVFRKIRSVAKSIRIVDPKAGKDATDHFVEGHGLEDFVPVYPIDRRTHPAQWQRNILRSSLQRGDPISEPSGDCSVAPGWPTGLSGFAQDFAAMRGVTVLTGGPSSGKTVLSVASSIETARAGWRVVYLVCEMPEGEFRERVNGYLDGRPCPESWCFRMVSGGVTLDALVEVLVELADGRPLLVIFDSVSSFTDQHDEQNSRDAHGYALAKRTLMWAVNARRQSQGQIGFLMLSERNANKETKFRIADHKADLAVTLDSDKSDPMKKHVHVVKGWRTKTGYIGAFQFNVARMRLEKTL